MCTSPLHPVKGDLSDSPHINDEPKERVFSHPNSEQRDDEHSTCIVGDKVGRGVGKCVGSDVGNGVGCAVGNGVFVGIFVIVGDGVGVFGVGICVGFEEGVKPIATPT